MADDWPEQIHAVLKQGGARQVAYVPDAGHSRLIDLCRADRDMRAVSLTTEEEGVGLLAGAWLGGEKGVLLMQSSGVGNCINAIASITRSCGFPLLMLVTMRGQWGEFNPWQLPMGQATAPVLQAVGTIVYPVEAAGEVAPTVAAAFALAHNGQCPVAVLLGQRLIGAKSFGR